MMTVPKLLHPKYNVDCIKQEKKEEVDSPALKNVWMCRPRVLKNKQIRLKKD